MVVTARNEAPILRDNLRYHHHLGVDEAFVFLDKTTDDTAASLRDLPFVHVAPSVAVEELPAALVRRPELVPVVREAPHNHCARQMLNAMAALGRARAAGCAWLLSIDADELVCPAVDELRGGHLREVLAGIPPSVDAVRFLPLEVVPTRAEYEGGAFRQATLFASMFGTGARVPPRHRAIRREMYDPIRGRVASTTGYFGHHSGKVAVRAEQDVVPFSVHRFRGPRFAELREQPAPWLLHYLNAGFDDFIRRNENFIDHAAHYVFGAEVEWMPKRLWIEMVNGGRFPRSELRSYYDRWICMDGARVRDLRDGDPESVIDVAAVGKVFATLDEG